jgi:hypothetical protein
MRVRESIFLIIFKVPEKAKVLNIVKKAKILQIFDETN